MGKAQREKGKRWEREIARRLRAIYGDAVRRGWQARTGRDGCDVEGAGPWWVECKAGRMPNPRAALSQAVRDCPPGRLPVAIVKDDRRAPFVVLDLEDWLDLCRELEERS